MNIKKIQCNLDCSKMGNQVCLYGIRQGDANTIQFVIRLTNQYETLSINSDSQILLYGLKPDGTKLCNSCTLDDEGNIVYTLHTQDTSVVGIVQYQLVVSSFIDGELKEIASPSFSYFVESRLFYPTYTALITQPDDWNENYSNYYEFVDGFYMKLTKTETPTFVSGRFYSCDGMIESTDEFGALLSALLKAETYVGKCDVLEAKVYENEKLVSARNFSVGFNSDGNIIWVSTKTTFGGGDFYRNAPDATEIVLGENVTSVSGVFSGLTNIEKVHTYTTAMADKVRSSGALRSGATIDVIESFNYTEALLKTVGYGFNSLGSDGKSAYEYAKDGGYTGTEEEFAEKLAKENPSQSDFALLQEEVDELKATLKATPILGTIDANNNIVLIGNLADGEYTLRYENYGEYTDIGTLVVGEGEPVTPPDTTLTWDIGTKIDISTGAETTGTTTYAASNYIEIKEVYTYTLKRTASSASHAIKVCYYDSSKNFISCSSGDILTGTADVEVAVPIVNGASYFRLRDYTTVSIFDETLFTLIAEGSA